MALIILVSSASIGKSLGKLSSGSGWVELGFVAGGLSGMGGSSVL